MMMAMVVVLVLEVVVVVVVAVVSKALQPDGIGKGQCINRL